MQAEQHFVTLAPCGILSFDIDGKILFANHYCCTILEYEEEELLQLNMTNLLTVSGKIFYQTHFFPLVKLHHHTEEIFFNLQSKTKKDIPVILNAVMVKHEKSAVINCAFLPVFNRRKYEDEILIARKKAEDALHKNEELERVKTELELHRIKLDKQVSSLKFQNLELVQLSNIISHDLQEPVRKLIFFSNELQNGGLEGDKKTHAIDAINRASKRAKKLLLNLQDYMGLTALTVKKEQVDVNNIINEELKSIKLSYPQVQSEITVTKIPPFAANENQLHILFHHLLDNAFLHAAADNKLTLNIDAVIVKENIFQELDGKYMYADFIKITIADKGPGYDPLYNDYIFEVLKKLNTSVDRLGLGLAFCRRIAENHHGYIKGKGMPGIGATFTITLPLE